MISQLDVTRDPESEKYVIKNIIGTMGEIWT